MLTRIEKFASLTYNICMSVKNIISMMAGFFMTVPAVAIEFKNSQTPLDGQYVLYVESTDYGPAAVKLVFKTKKFFAPQNILSSDFEVKAYISSDSLLMGMGLKSYDKTVTAAYTCDEHGNKISSDSQYIAIEFYCHPDDDITSPFTKLTFAKMNELYKYKIKNDKLSISISTSSGTVCPQAAIFKTSSKTYKQQNLKDTSQSDEITHNYAYYLPASTEKIPLIIFLHGITEGGTNPYVALMGVKSTALAQREIQKYFKNGAAVLVPQCPTTWLETTSLDPLGNKIWAPIDLQEYTNKITAPLDNFLSIVTGKQIAKPQPTANYSFYTLTLKNLIDDFIKENPQIDTNRIYIGGCSAGGYMTMNMIFEYKDFFAAAFPICQVYLDSKITDENIKFLANFPIWFNYADNDETVPPEKHSALTIERIKKLNPLNLHCTAYKNIIDQSGTVKKEDGTPYEYPGHFSWIPTLNNKSYEGDLNLFDWLSKQSK